MNDFLNDWGLPIATFLPLAGALIMMVIPKADEELHKVIALVSVAAGRRRSASGSCSTSTSTAPRTCSSRSTRAGSTSSTARFQMGIDGISLPLLLLTMLVTPLVIIYSWNHFPEPHNPKAFLILILILDTGMIGTFVAQDLILFFVFFEVVLLPDVLHDRGLGRRGAAVRLDQVLPVHAVRLGVDDRQLPGALLPRPGPRRST